MSQILTKGIAANAVDETRIRLKSLGALRARNAAGTADISLISVNAQDKAVLPAGVLVGANTVLDSSLVGAANGLAALDANGKIPTGSLPAAVLGALQYRGTLDASTAYPASPAKGDYYVISVAGTLGGHAYAVGDWAVYDGAAWEYVDNSQKVSSVNGKLGAVVLTSDDVAEGAANKYYTDARVLAVPLTGYTPAVGTVSATDSIESAIQKIDANTQALASTPSFTRAKEKITVSSGDLTNGYLTLAHTPLANSVILSAYGVLQSEGNDYSIAGTHVNILGDLAQLAAGDVVSVQYAY